MAFWKGPTRKEAKRAKRAAQRLAREACVLEVWRRAQHACERCRRPVQMSSTYFRDVGHVHETAGRSGGADPTDPTQCELLCYDCHFDGPSGAHTSRRSIPRAAGGANVDASSTDATAASGDD